MKIALVTTWNCRCGIATYSSALSKALANIDVDVYVIRVPRFGEKTPGIFENIVQSIPIDKVDLIHIEHEYGIWQQLEGGFYGSLKALGKPIITTMHAVGNFNVDKVISTTSDKVIVHNEFCAKRLGRPIFTVREGAPQSSMRGYTIIIPHGVQPEQCVPMDEAKRSYGFKPEWPIVGYLGFISDYKGLETLIEAMKGVEAGLLIGGGWHVEAETAYMGDLKRRSFEELPNRVQWLGFVPDADLPRAYGAMDLFVYPPRFATESGALLTALGHGKAVLASRLAPFKEKEKRGALETFTDAADLRRRIKRLLKSSGSGSIPVGYLNDRKRLEAGAWQYAQDNSWEKIAELHYSLYKDVMDKHGSR